MKFSTETLLREQHSVKITHSRIKIQNMNLPLFAQSAIISTKWEDAENNKTQFSFIYAGKNIIIISDRKYELVAPATSNTPQF